MELWSVCFFLCYLLLPVAFACGFGLLQHHPVGLVAILYYAVLLVSTWNLRRLGGWVGRFYLLAFAIVGLHLSAVGAMLVCSQWYNSWEGPSWLFTVVLLSIAGVWLAATWAATAMALRLQRPLEAFFQLTSPLLLALCSASTTGPAFALVLLGAQAVHALILNYRLDQPSQPLAPQVGLSPSRDEGPI